MRYNLARCLEHLCLFEDAEVLYKAILREQENYTDCTIQFLLEDLPPVFEIESASVIFKVSCHVLERRSCRYLN